MPAAAPPYGPTPAKHLPDCDSIKGATGGVVGRGARHAQLDPHLQPGVALASFAAQHGRSAFARQQQEERVRQHECGAGWLLAVFERTSFDGKLAQPHLGCCGMLA